MKDYHFQYENLTDPLTQKEYAVPAIADCVKNGPFFKYYVSPESQSAFAHFY